MSMIARHRGILSKTSSTGDNLSKVANLPHGQIVKAFIYSQKQAYLHRLGSVVGYHDCLTFIRMVHNRSWDRTPAESFFLFSKTLNIFLLFETDASVYAAA